MCLFVVHEQPLHVGIQSADTIGKEVRGETITSVHRGIHIVHTPEHAEVESSPKQFCAIIFGVESYRLISSLLFQM